jgi:DNA-binding MarR family transcriptional regulator
VNTQSSSRKYTIAAEVWTRIFDFLVATHEQRDRVLERFDITPGDSKALLHLDPNVGQSMGSLATSFACDASNATWMIDRLEQRGLVERRAMAGDRRVKAVVLTPLGVSTKAALIEALHEPPPELLELPLADLIALRDGVKKLPAVEAHGRLQSSFTSPTRSPSRAIAAKPA